MADEHLIVPADDVLPSTRAGVGVGLVLVLGCVAALGMAHQVRAKEVADSRAARAHAASDLTQAPPAKYPGGVDARPLDNTQPIGGPPGAATGPSAAPPPGSGPPRRGGDPPPLNGSDGSPPPPRPEHR